MTAGRTFFMVLSAAIAVLGLFTVGGARDLALTIFGLGLFFFGVLFGFSLIKRTYDEAAECSNPSRSSSDRRPGELAAP